MILKNNQNLQYKQQEIMQNDNLPGLDINLKLMLL